MAGLLFSVPVATAACSSTPKSILGVKAAANHCTKILGFYAGFDGVDSTKGPGLIEVCSCTFATNSPGTNSTTITPAKLDVGRAETIQTTAAKLWSAEPTVVTTVEDFTIPTYMGAGVVFFPLSQVFLVPGGAGCVLRITLPAGVTVNFTGSLRCEE